jgi:monoamine oxidase
MLSDRTTFGAQSCELGGELIDTGHVTMRDLAAELEIPLLDYTQDDPALAPLRAHFGGRVLTEAEILEGYAPIAEAIDAAWETLDDPEGDITYDAPNGAEALDAMSIRAWFDSIGATGPVRALLDVAYCTEYGLETDDSSALNLITMISTEAGKFELFGESDERFRARDGNDTFVTRLHAGLGAEQVLLGHRLLSVRPVSGALRLAFHTASGTTEVDADHVVLAIPFTLLRDVELSVELPPQKRRAIRELGYGTNAKLMAGFSSRPWRAQGSNGEVFTDLPFQCTWESSRLQPGASGVIANFTGGRHGIELGSGSVAEQLAAFVGDFDRVFPGARAACDGRAARMHWPTHAWTRGSYSSYRVGQWVAFRGAEIERVGKLHFCGEHTSLDAQGFMEGGAETGAAAAAEIAGDLGLARAPFRRLDPARRLVAGLRQRAALVAAR